MRKEHKRKIVITFMILCHIVTAFVGALKDSLLSDATNAIGR